MTMEWQRLTSAEQRGIQAWMQGGQKVPLALAVADLLFEAEDFSRAQQYSIALLVLKAPLPTGPIYGLRSNGHGPSKCRISR